MDKREKEMHTVYEMIHLYCRKNHKDKSCVQSVWLCMNMQRCALKSVLLWKQRHFVRNVRYIVTSWIKEKRYVR